MPKYDIEEFPEIELLENERDMVQTCKCCPRTLLSKESKERGICALCRGGYTLENKSTINQPDLAGRMEYQRKVFDSNPFNREDR